MKKNTMMRIASLLLVLTLASTCAISGTFAKYVTDGTGSDSARVAKFGVTVTANGTMFAKEYATDDANAASTIVNSVVSSTDKLLAPGTDGEMVEMTLTGTPEVAVRVNYEVTNISFTNWAVTGSVWYCPIVITISNGDNGTSTAIYGLNYADASAFQSAIIDTVALCSKDYPAGTNLASVATDALDISWSWAYEGTDGKQTDTNDTILGNTAANGTEIGFAIEVKTTVTQID